MVRLAASEQTLVQPIEQTVVQPAASEQTVVQPTGQTVVQPTEELVDRLAAGEQTVVLSGAASVAANWAHSGAAS